MRSSPITRIPVVSCSLPGTRQEAGTKVAMLFIENPSHVGREAQMLVCQKLCGTLNDSKHGTESCLHQGGADEWNPAQGGILYLCCNRPISRIFCQHWESSHET